MENNQDTVQNKFKTQCQEVLEKEHQSIDQELKDYYLSEITQTRFLKARNNKIDDALEMWSEFVKWHIKERPDKIQYEEMEHILKREMGLIIGVDKQKQTVLLVQSKYVDKLNQDEVKKFCQYAIETATRISEKNGQTKFTVIVEIKGVEKKHMKKEHLDKNKVVLQVLQAYYPERLAHLFIINANWIFKIAFNILKIFMDKNTISKLKILKSIDNLHEHIDASQLPELYKGTQKNQISFEDYSYIYKYRENYLEHQADKQAEDNHVDNPEQCEEVKKLAEELDGCGDGVLLDAQ